ncbi:hypothetical protein, partial [Lactobacillus delbrueckii]|uniref:hypothetical protein n=1 Tax=Lactobacillus delbrueckii TaxID=1584 RepID=UPI002363BBAD
QNLPDVMVSVQFILAIGELILKKEARNIIYRLLFLVYIIFAASRNKKAFINFFEKSSCPGFSLVVSLQ